MSGTSMDGIDAVLVDFSSPRPELLARLLMDDYFQLAPPKSTGFEYLTLIS